MMPRNPRLRILLFEYVCGGGWPDSALPESLMREGRAMWMGMVSDLLELPDVQVVTTWDARCGAVPVQNHPSLDLVPVKAPGRGLEALLNEDSSADVGLVIAPETDGLLVDCCGQLRGVGLKLLNCEERTLQICGDKLATWRHCESHGISSIPARKLSESQLTPLCVVKLREGAGSQEMQLVRTAEDWEDLRNRVDADRFIAQPYVPGRALSVAGIFHEGKLTSLLPVADQLLSTDGEFRYLGGRLPASGINQPAIEALVRSLEATLVFHGYVGFDLLQKDDAQRSVCLVEVNPRMTTSSVGYRKLLGPAVAECLLRGRPVPFHGSAAPVSFAVGGEQF